MLFLLLVFGYSPYQVLPFVLFGYFIHRLKCFLIMKKKKKKVPSDFLNGPIQPWYLSNSLSWLIANEGLLLLCI